MPLTDESHDRLAHELRAPGADRLLYVADAFRAAGRGARAELTHIDPWFLAQIEELVRQEAQVREHGFGALSAERLRVLKRKGFSDSRLARLLDMPEKAIRDKRHALGIVPVYKRVDTCAAEFATSTPTSTRPTRRSARRIPRLSARS